MHVIVAYDAEPTEQHRLRRLLSKNLHRIQNSVFAGTLGRIELDTLIRSLQEAVETARVQVWAFAGAPEIHHIGMQEDQESPFI